MIDRLISYAERYDTGFPSTLRGAKPAEIQRLEALCGQTLPEDYREYLQQMGQYSGRLFTTSNNMDFSLRAVVQFYEKADPLPPTEFLCIGVNDGSGDYDQYLVTGERATKGRVVLIHHYARFPLRSEPKVIFDSFEAFLFVSAFLSIRLPSLAHRGEFGPSASRPWDEDQRGSQQARLSDLARELRLAKVEEAGNHPLCFENDESAIYAHQPPTYGMYVEAGALTGEHFEHVSRILRDELLLFPLG